ncbi:THAP domain-containing protein 2-like [Nilaparvata lugens]|uniref:THAP domain-containing protein 2-like n=1 Tax=Nilaparvata lugens TaxID=108931 RepID=UPI00193E0880|nr:THAP domain-containing protein 2-like [Nilaparvata lugens]
MVGCSAPNCANKTEKGFRLFTFPTDEKRKAIWLQNCRLDKWKPTSNSRLCEDHFEENQWELHRADEWRKLKPNAIPTLFNVLNPPKKLISTRRSTYKDPFFSEIAGGATITENETANLGVGNGTALSHEAFPAGEEEQIKQLKNEVASLKEELQKKDSMMKSFLNKEQIAALQQTPNKWSAESILLGLKLRFSLGVNGYNFLRETKYPLPSIATLNRHSIDSNKNRKRKAEMFGTSSKKRKKLS